MGGSGTSTGTWTPLSGDPHDLVSRTRLVADLDPDRPMVVNSAGALLTYRQLVDRARELAPRLAPLVDPVRGVTMLTGDDTNAAVGLLAASVLRCRVGLVGANEAAERVEALIQRMNAPVVWLDRDDPTGAAGRAGAVTVAVRSDAPHLDHPDAVGDPTLMLSTSGSTSAPKVAVASCVRWRQPTALPAAYERQLDSAGVGTYASVNSLTAAMYFGGTSARFDPTTGSTSSLIEFVRAFRVTRLPITPTLLRSVYQALDGASLSDDVVQVNLRGERVTADDVALCREIMPRARVRHLYGSTEVGILALYEVGPDEPLPDTSMKLDTVLDGVELALLAPDGTTMVAEPGASGELMARSWQVFDGYVGEDADALDVLVDGIRWVRTGDHVEFDDIGRLRILGRLGRRVKVSGLFVDLDEVASGFEQHPAVGQAAVTSFDDGETVRLVGHLVPAPGATIDPVDVRADLGARLPVHMVPSLVRVVDSPPRGATGKLDHLALGEWRPPSTGGDVRPLIERPATPVEAFVLSTAEELLGRPIALDDDLIDAGFSSLDWLELVERIERARGVRIEHVRMFRRPTARGIAGMVDEVSDPPAIVELTPGATAPPVFWTLLGLAAQEPLPLAHALEGRSLLVPTPKGLVRPGRIAWRPGRIVDDMVEAIDARPDLSSLVVAGFSTGCLYARGVAARLVERGREVPLLVLLDPLPTSRISVRAARREVRHVIDRRALAAGELDSLGRHKAVFRTQCRYAAYARQAPYGGRVLLVRSEASRGQPMPSGLTGDVRTEVVPGLHRDVITHGERLAELLEQHLE